MAPYLSGESFTESNLNSATDGIIAKSMPAMQNSKEYDVGKGRPLELGYSKLLAEADAADVS